MSRVRDIANILSGGSSAIATDTEIPSYVAGKNFLINGGFDFWQRLSAPGTPAQYNANNGYPYSADRWAPMQYQSCRASRVLNTYSTPGPISQYAMQISSISSTDLANGARLQIQQKIESLNTYPLRGKYATLSFWIKFNDSTFTSTNNVAGGGSGAYGNFSASINAFTSTTDAYTGTTAIDSGVATINIINGSLPTVWTKYTTSGLVPLNTNNLNVLFGFTTLGSTTTNDFYNYQISDVQLEQGSSATSFSRAGGDIQGELAACQRYYYRTTPGTAGFVFGHCAASSATNGNAIINFPVTMRTKPTALEQSGIANQYQIVFGPTLTTCSAVPVFGGTTTATTALVNFTVASGLTIGQAGRATTDATNGATAYLGWSAEL